LRNKSKKDEEAKKILQEEGKTKKWMKNEIASKTKCQTFFSNFGC